MSNISTLGFNGEYLDDTLDSYHLGNGYRAYNPTTMQFTTPDDMSPFGHGGINPYVYCSGDPINNSDPTGHLSFSSVLGIVGTVVGAAVAATTIATGGLTIGIALPALGVLLGATSTGTGIKAEISHSKTLQNISLGLGIASIVTDLVSFSALRISRMAIIPEEMGGSEFKNMAIRYSRQIINPGNVVKYTETIDMPARSAIIRARQDLDLQEIPLGGNNVSSGGSRESSVSPYVNHEPVAEDYLGDPPMRRIYNYQLDHTTNALDDLSLGETRSEPLPRILRSIPSSTTISTDSNVSRATRNTYVFDRYLVLQDGQWLPRRLTI